MSSKKAHRQRLIGTAAIVALSACSEYMVSLVTPEDRLFWYYSVLSGAVVLLGVMASMVLLFYRADGRGLRFAPSWWDWSALYFSAAGICWGLGWFLAQGVGMVVELAPLPSILGILIVVMYRLEPRPEPVEQVIIREVTEEEWREREVANVSGSATTI